MELVSREDLKAGQKVKVHIHENDAFSKDSFNEGLAGVVSEKKMFGDSNAIDMGLGEDCYFCDQTKYEVLEDA